MIESRLTREPVTRIVPSWVSVSGTVCVVSKTIMAVWILSHPPVLRNVQQQKFL
jgi:hypothetical protein